MIKLQNEHIETNKRHIIMQINELLIVNYRNGYRFEVCKNSENEYMIMRFNYHNYGLNLTSDKTYKTLSSTITAGKNILMNHFKRTGYLTRNYL